MYVAAASPAVNDALLLMGSLMVFREDATELVGNDVDAGIVQLYQQQRLRDRGVVILLEVISDPTGNQVAARKHIVGQGGQSRATARLFLADSQVPSVLTRDLPLVRNGIAYMCKETSRNTSLLRGNDFRG